ncbi:hypothetical protein ACFQY0_21090 [Haloferula chungangensis]|uniref:Uncharacterized protein n=1 Tax=Haloferula chungangensis TaxID=1048331 RepID=A0ABW2LEA0_9BACT
MSDHSAKHIEQSRFSLALIKWLAIIALLLLPLSFPEGFADWRYLALATVAGLLWIAALVYHWKHESPLACGLGFLVCLGAYHLGNSVYPSEPPFGIFLQWLATFLAVAAVPVIVFRVRLLEYCGLNETKRHNKPQHPTA